MQHKPKEKIWGDLIYACGTCSVIEQSNYGLSTLPLSGESRQFVGQQRSFITRVGGLREKEDYTGGSTEILERDVVSTLRAVTGCGVYTLPITLGCHWKWWVHLTFHSGLSLDVMSPPYSSLWAVTGSGEYTLLITLGCHWKWWVHLTHHFGL